jgi:hypothetical protein
MPQPTFTDDPLSFADPYLTDWTDHPQRGLLSVPRAVNVSSQRYLYDVDGVDLAITIDIAGALKEISCCRKTDFNGNFATGDGVLLGNSDPGQMPLHLSFNPPLKSVGAHVSASGAVGEPYKVLMDVLCSDGSGGKFSADGMLSRTRGSAPFAGAIAPPGAGITDLWFDTVHPGNTVQFAKVAINNLLWEL